MCVQPSTHLVLWPAQPAVIEVELGREQRSLLDVLARCQARVLRAVGGISDAVAASSTFELGQIEAAIQASAVCLKSECRTSGWCGIHACM